MEEKRALLDSHDDSVKIKTDRKPACQLFAGFALLLFISITLFAVSVYSSRWFSSPEVTIPNGEPDVKTFWAAAYEQKLVNTHNAVNRGQALQAMRGNLNKLKKQAKIASEQGVKVMVFAEYGITGNMGGHYHQRSSVYPYMEEIPEVSMSQPHCVNCEQITPEREGQTTIGCIALKYKMYVVGNLIECVKCNSTIDRDCPTDGHYQYNTNIVYDPSGCLIAKYHKYHRFAEELKRLDRPKKPEYVYFDTEYGRFGTIICLDAMYKEPGLALVERYNIDHMLFPTDWDNSKDFSYQTALDWQLAFAARNNINFIAANVHSIADFSYGSGILSGKDVINYTSNDTVHRGSLIIGELPINRPPRPKYKHPITNYPPNSVTSGTAILYGDAFNVVMLQGLTGSAKVCQNLLCCFLDYERNVSDEMFILGAFRGLHRSEESIFLETCILYKCGNESFSSCSGREIQSTTSFPQLKLSGNFSSEYVYPVMSPSGFRYDKLNWTLHRSDSKYPNSIVSTGDWPLIAVALVGRPFNLDPKE